MPSQINNYQCPACTGPLHFDSDTGKLVCDYCGSTYTVAEIDALMLKEREKAEAAFKKEHLKEQETENQKQRDGLYADGWDFSELDEQWEATEGDMNMYNCPSCGAELVCDMNTAATQCPYCGNPTVVPGQFSGMIKPAYVIPFDLDKDTAIDSLKKFYKGKILLPGKFKSGNQIEKVQGLYVPFWLFDGTAYGDLFYHATKVRSYTRGDYNITETRHFNVHRKGSMAFQKIPVDGSEKMDDALMDSIEPFDYNGLKPFSTGYFAGYLADKYDVSAEAASERAGFRAVNGLIDRMDETISGYTSVNLINAPTGRAKSGKTDKKEKISKEDQEKLQSMQKPFKEVRPVILKGGKVQYAMFPVWLLNTKWNDKQYTFAVNGQTGKVSGKLPVSKAKVSAFFFGISIPLMAIAAAIMLL